MIDTLIYTVAIIAGFSLRSPNELPNPFDYEVSGGVEYTCEHRISHKGAFWGWYERKNGIEYLGLDLKVKVQPRPFVELSGDFVKREAQDMQRAGLSCALVVLKYGRIGIAGVLDHVDFDPTAFLGIEHKYGSGRVDFYRKGFESAKVSGKYAIRLFDGPMSIEPRVSYNIDRNRNQHYSAKITVKVEFDGGKHDSK